MLNKYLGQLLSDHHIEFSEVNGKYQIADGITISAQSFKGVPGAELSIQGDYTLRVGEKGIIESFGLPADDNEDDICKKMTDYFANASFHVMMSYVFGTEDEQNRYEEWDFHGTRRKMIIGPVNSRFSDELAQTDLHLTDIQGWAKDYIQNLRLDHGLNWIRVYVFQMNGEIKAAELLIKNRPIPEFLEYMRGIPFAKANGFYSYRNFMIIQEDLDVNKITKVMPREDLILEILRIADENPRIDDTEFLKFLALHSEDPQDAVLGFGFFQAGFFRRAKNKLGGPFSEVHLSENYLIADADGTIIETGKLIDQEWYKAAFSAPDYCITGNNLMAIVGTFSEAKAVFDAVEKGQKLGDLTFGPVIQFTSTPTESGLAKVQSLVVQQMGGQKKPRWKFW